MQNDVAELAGLVFEAGLYGVFFVLTIFALHGLIWKRRGGPLNMPYIITSLLMFALATTQIILNTKTVFDAFIDLDRPHRQALLLDLTLPINIAKRAIFFTMMILGDLIAIYRCYIVWMRNWWLIIVPSFCALVSAVLCYMSIWATQHLVAGRFILVRAHVWGLATFVLSLISNAIATSLVAYRLWYIDRQFCKEHVHSTSRSGETATTDHTHVDSQKPPSSLQAPYPVSLSLRRRRNTYNPSNRPKLRPIALIIVESGILNTVYLIAYITVLQIEKGGRGSVPIIIDMATPLVGIIFSLVIVRTGVNTPKSNVHSRTNHGTRMETMHFNDGPTTHDEEVFSTIVLSTINGPRDDYAWDPSQSRPGRNAEKEEGKTREYEEV